MNRQLITAILVIAALGAIGVLNYMRQMDPVQLAARGVGKPAHSHEHKEDHEPPPLARADEEFVVPIGPEDAPVKLTVCYAHVGIVKDQYRGIAEEIAASYPDKVRIEFRNSEDADIRKILDRFSPDLANCVLIDGELVRQVPNSPFGAVAFAGAPQFEDWSVEELKGAVEYALKEKGVPFTPHAHEAPISHAFGHHHQHDENDRIPH